MQETKLVVKQNKQTKKTLHIKIRIYLCFPAEVCYRNRGSKGCLSLSRNRIPHTFGDITKRTVTKTFKALATFTSAFQGVPRCQWLHTHCDKCPHQESDKLSLCTSTHPFGVFFKYFHIFSFKAISPNIFLLILLLNRLSIGENQYISKHIGLMSSFSRST